MRDDTNLTQPQQHLLEYLDKMRLLRTFMGGPEPPPYPYLCVEDLVRQHGAWMPSPTTLDMRYRGLRGRVKYCYYNAAMALVADPTLRYCEGFCLDLMLGLPLMHAWCLSPKGDVLELTWPIMGEDIYNQPDQCARLGVIIPREVVFERIERDDGVGLLDDWEGGFPLLAQPWPWTGLTDAWVAQQKERLNACPSTYTATIASPQP